MVESCALSWLNAFASRSAAATTPSFAAALVGEFARLDQALQKFESWLAMPVEEGSLNAL